MDIVTIDSLIEEKKIGIPDVIKIDTQGFDLEVLKGAEKTYGHTELYIVEVSVLTFRDDHDLPEFYEIVHFMNERGYVVYDFLGFSKRPFDGALGQCDIAFVKKNGKLRADHRWA